MEILTDDSLRVDLARTGGCVASHLGAPLCPAQATQTVTLNYCEHVEARSTRCPDPDTCGSSRLYDVEVCGEHEAAIRDGWVCYVASEPIEPANPDRRCRNCGATSGLKMLHSNPLTLAPREWECHNCGSGVYTTGGAR